MSLRMPTLFVSHGAPTLALDATKGRDLQDWGRSLPRPRSILVVSAHWETEQASLGTSQRAPLLYDFWGFPPPLYEISYPAPGAPQLAERVHQLLGPETLRLPGRGLDHGAWVPLLHLFPRAEIPVLQLSLPRARDPRDLLSLGEALRPLREEGVLLLGSGALTHDLRSLAPDGTPPDPDLQEFDQWLAARLRAQDLEALVQAEYTIPDFSRFHPSLEHWRPLLFTLGTSHPGEEVRFPVEGWEFGVLTRRSVQFG